MESKHITRHCFDFRVWLGARERSDFANETYQNKKGGGVCGSHFMLLCFFVVHEIYYSLFLLFWF